MTGFGEVHPLPGIWDSLHLDSAITLPIGVEAYGAYARSHRSCAGSADPTWWRRASPLMSGMPGSTPGPWAVTSQAAARCGIGAADNVLGVLGGPLDVTRQG